MTTSLCVMGNSQVRLPFSAAVQYLEQMDTFVGFDSAWTDSPKAPGAICAVSYDGPSAVFFHPSQLASYLALHHRVRSRGGSRTSPRCNRRTVSDGGISCACDGIVGLAIFRAIGGSQIQSRPEENLPYRDWTRVAEAAARQSLTLGCTELAHWFRDTGKINQPRKADQDRMDAALCVLIALCWRRRPRCGSLLLGDLATGYMVRPASLEVRERLSAPARKHSVPIDGLVP